MKPIRIFFGYRHIDAPWGGANNFIRALNGYFSQAPDFTLVDGIHSAADVLFLNQLGKGRGGETEGGSYKISDLKKWKKRNPTGKIVVRAVNLRAHSNPHDPIKKRFGNFLRDYNSIAALNLADFVIFQSLYQKSFFVKGGYKGTNNTVIHNGAPADFIPQNTKKPRNETFNLVSTSMSMSKIKRHDIISALSLIEGVSIKHAGPWPPHISPGNVQVLGVQAHDEIIRHMEEADYFLHPAQHDVCPNSVIEALHFGLPVLYHPGPGSSEEIVHGSGLALDEDNLGRSAQEAREKLDNLTRQLGEQRYRFSIARAAEAYASVFRQLIV